MSIDDIVGADRIVPVLAFQSVDEALAVSRVLVGAGIRLLEVTLRTPVALDCIRELAAALPAACVGVGTVLEPAQLLAARRAGAVFGVSPGLTPALAEAIRAEDFPFIPGASSVSELMRAREQGFRLLKFFPAEAVGGARFIKSLQDVLPDVAFCATGGLNADNAAAYLGLRNVRAIGGSWMVVRDAAGEFDPAATRLAVQDCLRMARRSTLPLRPEMDDYRGR